MRKTMTPGVSTLIRLIEEVSGNVVPERDTSRLTSVVQARARKVGVADVEAYVRLLRRDQDGAEWRHLLSLITVNESYLFRAHQQFEALVDQALPDLLSRRSERRLRLWSAGCARGEEASTLAIVLAECPLIAGWDWRIVATDVDQEALLDARRGVYGRRAVAKVPPPLLERYFTPRGEDFELVAKLRDRIEYRELNLVREPLDMPLETFDVVFFRNVLIYFRPASQVRVAEAVARTMLEDGYLFLGSSESLWHVFPDLMPVDLGSCFCYRWVKDRPGAAVPDPEATVEPTPEAPRSAATPVARREAGETETEEEAAPVATPTVEEAAMASRKGAWAAIVEALKGRDLEIGRHLIREATKVFPEDAVVRAFDGLAYDLDGEIDRAIRAYRAALYLDPYLYQVRYLLARCMERIGWRERAEHEFAAVLTMMASPQSRVLPGDEDLGLPRQTQIRAAHQMRGGEPR